MIPIINRLPVNRRIEYLRKLSRGASKRGTATGLPLSADQPRVAAAWTDFLYRNGVCIEEMAPSGTALHCAIGGPNYLVGDNDLTCDPDMNAGSPASFVMSRTRAYTDVTYATPGRFESGVTNGGAMSGEGIVDFRNVAPPLADAGVDQAVAANAQVTLTGAVQTTPNLGGYEYIWTQSAGTTVAAFAALPGAQKNQRIVGPFNIGAAGATTFTLTVIGPNGIVASDTIVVTAT